MSKASEYAEALKKKPEMIRFSPSPHGLIAEVTEDGQLSFPQGNFSKKLSSNTALAFAEWIKEVFGDQ